MKLAKGGIILLLCLINFLNYVDRGIIPGAPEVFEDFIRNTLGVAVSRQALFFGILASSFIASYAIFSILFGYLSTYYPPFNIIICGMSIWCIATTCCGLAQYIESYYLLLLGRVLTGVGEASFQCTAAPLIDDYAPPTQRSIWMGIFLSSISVRYCTTS
jgi:MFS family permease